MMAYPVLMSMGLGGTIIGAIYSVLFGIYYQIKNKLVVTVQIRYDDETFLQVNKYMQDMGYINYNSNLRAKVKRDNKPWWEKIFEARDDRKIPELEYSAGGGKHHVFEFKGRTMWVFHREGETIVCGDERMPTVQEDMYIHAYGTDPAIIKEFIRSA